MPLVAAAAITAGSQLFNASMQSKSADNATRANVAAADRAARAQREAADKAEAFARQQAQNAYANDEAARRGNYEQWAATEGRRGTIGELLGLGKRNIPAYAPGVDPNFGGGGTSGPMPVPGSGRQTTGTGVDAYGRPPGDPMYGVPAPSPRAPKSRPANQGSVDSYLRPIVAGDAPPEPEAELHTYQMDPAEVEAARRRKMAGASQGSVGSYLRTA